MGLLKSGGRLFYSKGRTRGISSDADISMVPIDFILAETVDDGPYDRGLARAKYESHKERRKVLTN